MKNCARYLFALTSIAKLYFRITLFIVMCLVYYSVMAGKYLKDTYVQKFTETALHES